MTGRIQQIQSLGQAIWLDYISRRLLSSGELQQRIDEGVSGMTSNPTIFQKAIADGHEYDEQLRTLAAEGQTAAGIYEQVALQDIGAAADALRPVYNETHGRDGFVSLEVSPTLAHDTEGTIEEARRLFAALSRPNVMIKVPATEAGLPAITTLIGEGINVNVTLIFAVAMHARVIDAYLQGLDRLRERKRPLSAVSSVASFFVSRVDTLVDQLLSEQVAAGRPDADQLLGEAAVANAKLAYQKYKEVFEGARFAEYRAEGARVQRPLWASTSTKNPAYHDTKYIDTLIGVNTVNSMPPQTLDAVRDHGVAAQTIEEGLDQAYAVFERLAGFDIDMTAVTDQLLAEGLKAFADSFELLLTGVEAKRREFAGR